MPGAGNVRCTDASGLTPCSRYFASAHRGYECRLLYGQKRPVGARAPLIVNRLLTLTGLSATLSERLVVALRGQLTAFEDFAVGGAVLRFHFGDRVKRFPKHLQKLLLAFGVFG